MAVARQILRQPPSEWAGNISPPLPLFVSLIFSQAAKVLCLCSTWEYSCSYISQGSLGRDFLLVLIVKWLICSQLLQRNAVERRSGLEMQKTLIVFGDTFPEVKTCNARPPPKSEHHKSPKILISGQNIKPCLFILYWFIYGERWARLRASQNNKCIQNIKHFKTYISSHSLKPVPQDHRKRNKSAPQKTMDVRLRDKIR